MAVSTPLSQINTSSDAHDPRTAFLLRFQDLLANDYYSAATELNSNIAQVLAKLSASEMQTKSLESRLLKTAGLNSLKQTKFNTVVKILDLILSIKDEANFVKMLEAMISSENSPFIRLLDLVPDGEPQKLEFIQQLNLATDGNLFGVELVQNELCTFFSIFLNKCVDPISFFEYVRSGNFFGSASFDFDDLERAFDQKNVYIDPAILHEFKLRLIAIIQAIELDKARYILSLKNRGIVFLKFFRNFLHLFTIKFFSSNLGLDSLEKFVTEAESEMINDPELGPNGRIRKKALDFGFNTDITTVAYNSESFNQIKREFRKLAVAYHPDKNSQNPNAEFRMQAINTVQDYFKAFFNGVQNPDSHFAEMPVES